MSMCRVCSCVIGKEYLLWPSCSLDKTLLTFVLLHFVLQSQTCMLLQVPLDFLLLHSNRVSTWLGLSAQIFGQTFFWMFLWRWLNEVNTEIGGLQLKHITFHNVDLPHPISWRPDWNKDWPPLSETKFCQYTTSGLKLATLPWVSSVSA